MTKFSDYIFDIVQNAIEAHTTKLSIEMIKQKKLVLKISDNGIGMSKKTIKQVTSPFYTSRTTRNVGLGLPFIILLSKQTNGNYKIKSKMNKGTTVTFIFDHHHIDFPPIGDLGLLIADIAMINQLEQFDFLYQVNKEHFNWTYHQQSRLNMIAEINDNIKKIEELYENFR